MIRRFLPERLVISLWHWPKAVLANLVFGFPGRRLKIIGVTGTDGKTTTATLIYHLLLQSSKKAALISTVAAKIGLKELSTGLHVTSPDPWVLQKLLKEIVRKKIDWLVLESTSHGLAQHRLWGIPFQIGVVTNVTHEHLDYHRTYKRYLQAKGKLFKKVAVAVLNIDDQSFSYLDSVRAAGSTLVTYGIKGKALVTPKTFPFKTKLPGEYNLYNCLAAIAVGQSLKIADQKIRQAVASFKGVVGRMDKIDLGQNFEVLVDFAHTPNALKQVLKTLKKKKGQGRLIVVFGCAGLRDRQKRPMMGKIAGQLADIVVLTAEDPRTEDINLIIDQIAQGCLQAGVKERRMKNTSWRRGLVRIPDRREAIKWAINTFAKKGDLVVLCGKGHEKSLCLGTTEHPWSDHQEAKRALEERAKQ